MQNLNDLESSVLKLSDADYAEFRKWFWEHENERWDIQLEQDIKEKKLEDLATKAIAEFKQGKYKQI